MLLERLELCDVGTFRGEQVFDLRPKSAAGRNRPVVLFGGLNGAGKTTLLNSIRHVLYGRQALEGAVTQRGYEEFLRGLIHSPSAQLVRTDRAHIELRFAYSRLGELIKYRVCRSWVDKGSTVEETLTVTRNDETKPLLDGDSAQSFLNQLIPPGVSQFFFFDGEKIAALAKDDSDSVLADAIRRLLGLDVADRLRSDLSVFLRARRAEHASVGAREELKDVYGLVESAKQRIAEREDERQRTLIPKLTRANEELERCRSVLSDHGGAWAVDRKALERQLDDLASQKAALEEQLREDLAGIGVFGLVPKLGTQLLEQVTSERKASEKRLALGAVSEESKQLKALLLRSLKKRELGEIAAQCVDQWLITIDKRTVEEAKPLHHYTGSDVESLESSLRKHLPTALAGIHMRAAQLQAVNAESTRVQDKLAHAPTDESIAEAFEAYQAAMRRVAEAEAEIARNVEEVRVLVAKQIELTRKASRMEETVDRLDVDGRSEVLATRVQEMIADFKVAAAEAKCKTLERHFVSAFKRLARKEDIVDRAVIDPATFAVTLVDRHGRSTPKKRLSAGEKQIFAIAMLEALAKTSGRNLPIIIDTPLGRLDSKHRAKLVDGYLPYASHQVLVLSTDTEVDRAFYEGLRPSISHAFHLAFNESEGYTSASHGYFWKHLESAHAA